MPAYAPVADWPRSFSAVFSPPFLLPFLLIRRGLETYGLFSSSQRRISFSAATANLHNSSRCRLKMGLSLKFSQMGCMCMKRKKSPMRTKMCMLFAIPASPCEVAVYPLSVPKP